MADIFFGVTAPEVDTLMQTYSHIRIFKASMRHGLYMELTSPGSRIVLQHGVTQYTYHDPNGLENEWYRSTFFAEAGPVESMPSDERNFGAWGILADSLSRRLLSEGGNLTLGQLYDAIFDASCDTVPVPDSLVLVDDISLSWLIRRAVRHALALLINDYVAKPSVSKSTVNVSLQSAASSLMQRVRQLDEEWQTARKTDIRIFEGKIVQLSDSSMIHGEIVGSGYQIDPLSGYDRTDYSDSRVESIYDRMARW